MDPEEIKSMIEAGIPGCTARVTGDGSHFDASVISDEFAGKTMVKKQQMVFATLGDNITSGRIHALNIKAYTAEEWEQTQTA